MKKKPTGIVESEKYMIALIKERIKNRYNYLNKTPKSPTIKIVKPLNK